MTWETLTDGGTTPELPNQGKSIFLPNRHDPASSPQAMNDLHVSIRLIQLSEKGICSLRSDGWSGRMESEV
jgi:hypothetical protein